MVKLMHGNCLELMKSIPDGSIDAIITDPPYGTTACKWDSVIPFTLMWQQLNRIIKPNGAIIFTATQPFTSLLVSSNLKHFKYEWIWKKKNPKGFLNAKKMPLKNVENVLVFYKSVPTYNPQGIISVDKKRINDNSKNGINGTGISSHNGGKMKGEYTQEFSNYPTQILEFGSEQGLHPTQKPVELMEYLIKTYTNENETVLDFTMGSGTTGVACVNTNRKFIGIEMDDNYFEIAKNRIGWSN